MAEDERAITAEEEDAAAEESAVAIVPANEVAIRDLIYTVRGTQVMLDSDLAALYGVETKVFNQAVRRNVKRFPERFRFQLTREEAEALRSQINVIQLRKCKVLRAAVFRAEPAYEATRGGFVARNLP